MSLRESVSRLKKDFKSKLKGKKPKQDRKGADTGGERADQPESSRSSIANRHGDIEQDYPSSSAAIQKSSTADSMWIWSFSLFPLIVPLNDTDTPIVPDHESGDLLLGENTEPSTTQDEKKVNQESNIPPTVKLDNVERDRPSSSVSLPRGADPDGIDPNFVLFSPSDRSS